MAYFSAITASQGDPSRLRRLLIWLLQCGLILLLCSTAALGSHSGQLASSTKDSPIWSAPVAGTAREDILQPFIPPAMPWSAAHRGVDLRAASGQVVAPASGEVTFVGTVVDRTVLTIRHSNGLLSSFEPIETELEVGDEIVAGQSIGSVATESSHCAVRCIHWGVRRPDAWHIENTVRDLYIDPAFLLGWSEPSVSWPIETAPGS